NVPAGQPKDVGHGPPFTWEESATSAVKYDHLDKVTTWSPMMMCFQAECHYNGRGYFKHGVNSPYVWCGTNLYGDPPNVGKYTSDGVWNGSYVSRQIGVAAIMKSMGITTKLPDIETKDPRTTPDILTKTLNDLFGHTKPGQDNTDAVHHRLDALFGGDWVGGLNKLFGKGK
ncbi:MAG TPA: hypothetical protein VFK47_21120, partial [Ktedonobacteraceae bacterium]|nr:hypothetical protein [Ktedonobacteraceae bacterium]